MMSTVRHFSRGMIGGSGNGGVNAPHRFQEQLGAAHQLNGVGLVEYQLVLDRLGCSLRDDFSTAFFAPVQRHLQHGLRIIFGWEKILLCFGTAREISLGR